MNLGNSGFLLWDVDGIVLRRETLIQSPHTHPTVRFLLPAKDCYSTFEFQLLVTRGFLRAQALAAENLSKIKVQTNPNFNYFIYNA